MGKEKLEDVMSSDEYAWAFESAQRLIQIAPQVNALISLCNELENKDTYEKFEDITKKVVTLKQAITKLSNEKDMYKEQLKEGTKVFYEAKNEIIDEFRQQATNEFNTHSRYLIEKAENMLDKWQKAKEEQQKPAPTGMTKEVVALIEGLKSANVEITDTVVASVINACSYSNYQRKGKDW